MLTTSAFLCCAPASQQHRHAFAIEEDDRADVDVELHVQALGLDLADGRADAHARVVDEHVEAAVALAMRGDDLLDLRLVGDVRRDAVHVEAIGREPRDGALELLRAPGGHRDAIALFAENPRDRQADPAGCPRDDRRALCHLPSLRSLNDSDAPPDADAVVGDGARSIPHLAGSVCSPMRSAARGPRPACATGP